MLIPGLKNVSSTPLINHEKVYLPLLRIILELIKNFVMAMDQNRAGLMYLKNKFTGISDAKIKEGVFGGPQERELMQDPTVL